MRHGLNDQFYLFYWGGKFHTTNRTCIVQIHKDKTAIQLCWQVISYFKTCRHLARLQPSRIQWKISKLATLSATLLFLSLSYCRYCGLFLWKWMKNNPFWMHHFFSQWKILIIQIFDLILDNFSKEIHPKYQYII